MADIEGIPDFPILNNPLTTEEGFVNEACLNELASFLKNMPETHERLANEPEWTVRMPTMLGEVMGAFAGNAVHAFNGSVPPDLEKVIGYLRARLERTLFSDPIWKGDGKIMANVSLCDINRSMWRALGDLDLFENWNKREVVGDGWIDLSALLHQVCVLIRNERRHFAAFNNDFERRNGKLSNPNEEGNDG